MPKENKNDKKEDQPDLRKAADKTLARAILKRENDLRTLLAALFLIVYLIFIITVVTFWIYDLANPVDGRTQDIKDMILTIYGILAGPLGLIIGYYFGAEKSR